MSEVGKATLFSEDLIEDATLSVSSEAISADNAASFQLGEKWRSTGVALEWIKADFGQTEGVPFIALVRHNLSTEATIRVRISDNADLSAPSFDGTYYAWPTITGYDEGQYDKGGYDGTPDLSKFDLTQFRTILPLAVNQFGTVISASNQTVVLPNHLITFHRAVPAPKKAGFYDNMDITIIDGTGAGQRRNIASYDATSRTITVKNSWNTTPDNTSRFRIDVSQALNITKDDGTYQGRYLRVDIADSSNSSGYIELGRLLAGSYIQPEFDIDFDYSIEFIDPSQQFISDGQNRWVNRKNKFRSVQARWSFLNESEARSDFWVMFQNNGSSKPVLFVPFLENSRRAYTDTVYGLIARQTDNANYTQLRQTVDENNYQVNVKVEELL